MSAELCGAKGPVPREDAWDQALREAYGRGEAIVVRGDMIARDFELDVVPIDGDAADPFADATARAFVRDP